MLNEYDDNVLMKLIINEDNIFHIYQSPELLKICNTISKKIFHTCYIDNIKIEFASYCFPQFTSNIYGVLFRIDGSNMCAHNKFINVVSDEHGDKFLLDHSYTIFKELGEFFYNKFNLDVNYTSRYIVINKIKYNTINF